MKIDYIGAPEQTLEELQAKYNPDMYLIMDDVLDSPKSFKKIYQDTLDICKLGYEKAEIRNEIVRFKLHTDDKKYFNLPRKNFLSLLILYQAFMEIERVDVLTEEHVFDFRHKRLDDVIEYINKFILPIHPGDFHAQCATVDEIWYHMIMISYAFTPIFGLGVSDYDIMKMEERNPELTVLMNKPIDDSLQTYEIEDELNDRIKQIIKIICNDKEYNHFMPLYASGKNLSEGQSKEIFGRIGFKADINGHTITTPIDTNFLIGGLIKPSYFYINNLSGRKAGIFSKTKMSDPGAFSKKLNWAATSPSYLRQDEEMCTSTMTVNYFIEDEDFLNCLNGRYYYDERGEMHCLNMDTDKHLIGRTLAFRGPATCNSTKGICKYCYGKLYDINKDLFSVGSLAATKSSEPLGQSVLSTKHNQQTSSSAIEMTEGFEDYMELNSGEISLSDNADTVAYIVLGDVVIDESDDSMSYYTKSFDLVNADGEILQHIEESNGSNLFLTDTLIDLYNKAKDKLAPISLDNIDDDEALFLVEVNSKEVMGPIKKIKAVVANNSHGGAKDLDSFHQIFARTMLDAGIKYDFVHGECILRSLIRKKSDVTEFPDWGPNGDHSDYQIIQIHQALMNNPSPLIRISTGYLKKHLQSTDLYKVHAPSHIDALFVEQLSNYIDD